MNWKRWLVLIAGPFPILAASFLLSNWVLAEPKPSSNRVLSNVNMKAAVRPEASSVQQTDDRLRQHCEKAAERWQSRLGEECAVVVREPFVIAGNLSSRELDSWYQRTIYPATLAVQESYVETHPDRPISVLLFDSKDVYADYADALFGDRGVSIYGYYKPTEKTLVMNIATGGGTLVHELTHALVDFDFPRIPDWFNEGLASLHEQCRFRTVDGRREIEGLENWRLAGLQKAIRNDDLPPIKSLIENRDFRGANVGRNYAQARYFCMYLQQHEELKNFYQSFRDGYRTDPTGIATAKKLFPEQTWEEVDSDFRAWVMTLRF